MKYFFTILFLTICSFTYAQNSIYFDVLSKNTEIGIGRCDGQIILSIITKSNRPISVSFEDQFGEEYLNSNEFEVDTIVRYKIGNRKVVEYDWILSPRQLMTIYNKVNGTDVVRINKEEFSATVFVAVLQKLEKIPLNASRMRFFGIRSFFK